MARSVVWFREHDLRVHDHAPLRAANRLGEVIPLFVVEPEAVALGVGGDQPNANRMQFIVDSLHDLERSLSKRGSGLVIARGRAVDVVTRLTSEWSADRVMAHTATDPRGRSTEANLCDALGDRFQLFDGETLHPPGSLRTGAGQPYSVFTAFARAFRAAVRIGQAEPAPRSLPALPRGARARRMEPPSLASLGTFRNEAVLPGGERQARHRLRRFLSDALSGYPEQRDRMDLAGTSRISADLTIGTLSVREVWNEVEQLHGQTEAAACFLNQLLWREFAKSTLWDRPDVLKHPFKPAFSGFPWRQDETQWHAWVQGMTGYPIVDAAARQLLAEGFVHNRARMVAASFLTKHLLIDYRQGEAHYLRFLVDADVANNNLGWQWSAGSGCDAQPYYRVFNPVIQGQKFDSNGDYVRRWVPELGQMPTRFIHRPWEAEPAVLRRAGVRLGRDYPEPIVAHRFVHERFLDLAKRHLRKTPG